MSKRIIKANQKVLHDSMEEKKRFHLYKSGKLWLVAGLATLSFATGGLSSQLMPQSVHADVATSDGDSITLNGDVVTISLLTDVSHEHYLAHAETQKLYDYIKANNLKVVDQTLVEYNNYYDAEGNRVAAYNKRNVYRGDYATIEYRASDALIGLFYQAGKENSSFWRDAKWYPDLLGSDFGHWKATGGHDGEDKTLDADLGLMFSHTINGAAASDSFIIAGEFKDESTSFYIDNGDGTKLDLFNDKDDVTNTISWSRTGDLNSISNLPDHYAGEHIGYIFSADQVNEFIRAQAYAYEHEDDGATFNGQQFDGPEAGHHNAIIQPLNTTNKYQVNQIINIYDADGNLLYYVTELATGGEIIVNSDATMADLLNTADDVSAKGNYDITDVFDNFANGLNGDGTKGDGIKYRVNDGKTPSNDPKGTGIGAYSGNYADSLADGAPDIDYYMIEQADATITYVDEDKDGAQVGDPVKVSGDINTSKDVTIDIPEGYEYAGTNGVISADGKTVTITLTDDDSDNVTILLKHHQTPVTPDDPSDPNYDATHTTSRETIHYVDENGNQAFPDNTDQTLDFVRTVIIDDVTNEVVGYGEWTPVSDSEFAAVTSPEKTGYTPDTPVVEGQKPEISTDEDGNEIVQANPEITVTYHANAETATVTYIDDDATDPNKNVVSTKTITGKMDGTKDVTITIPDGYEYVGTDGGKLSDDGKTVTITFTDNDSDDVTIHLKHHQTHVDPSDPRATKEVHETINYWNDESGKKIHASDTVAIDFSRTVLVDDITGEVTYGEWEADFGDTTFDGRDTYVIDGYFADIQHVDDITGVTPDTEDVTINVYYYATDQQVQPDDPKNDGEQIDPDDSNSPVYPAGVTSDDLNKFVTETVHYVDAVTGEEIADPALIEVHCSRVGHVIYNQDGTVKDVKYDDWVVDDEFYDVYSPQVSGYFADRDMAGAYTVTDGQTLKDFDITVYYYKRDQPVDPSSPKNDGDKINPDDPYSPAYPADVGQDTLNAEVKQEIHYVDQSGKELASTYTITVHYTRTAVVHYDESGKVTGITYSDWSADDSFDAVTSPDVDGYFTLNKTVAGKTVTDPQNQADFSDTVIYYKTDQDVTPDDPKTPDTPINPDDPSSPVYPDDVDEDDLNADVAQTIHYVDENGNELDSYTKTIHYTRTAHITYDQNGKASVSYSGWVADNGDSFDAVTSPTIDGYFTLDKTVAGKTVDDPQKQADFSDTVIYYKTDQDVTPDDPKTPDTPVNPSDPDSPDYPDGVDYDDLNADVKETVHYVDEKGNELAETYTKTVHYERTAHIKYDKDGNASVTYGDWTADGSFDVVQSPDIDGYFTLNKTVDGKTVTDPQHQADFEENVIYYPTNQDVTPDDPKTPDTPINPSDPDSPDYPDGVDYDDLNADVKETVHYVDENGNELAETYTKTVHYERTAHVSYDQNGKATVTYSDWSANGSFDAVQSPDIDGYFTLNKSIAGKTVTDPQGQPDFNETVIYYKTNQDVTPDDPKTPDTPVNPSDPDSPDYPDGVDYDDLNADVKETVHYVDENGKEIAKTYTKTVHHTRTAHVTFDQNGNATVTYSDWSADGSFDAVQSPDVDGYFTMDASVAGKTVTDPQHQADFEDTVIYYKSSQNVTPDDPKAPDTPINPSDPNSPVYPDGVDEDDLNQDVTETIHYVDAKTGEELADTYTKTVHYTRNATVNYDANGNATVTYSDWTAQDSFGAVDSPDIDGYVADQTTVSGREVNATDDDFDITVNYYDNDQHVTPDSPKHNGDKIDPSNPNSPVFPAGVDESDLNKDVTETIHYVDENGNELADTYTKTVHYTRDAHVHYDADGNTTITYGDWVADGSFDAVNSPEIDGYVADQDVIAALDNPTDNVDIVVTYHHAEVAPTPAPEKPTPAPKPAPAPTKTVTPAHVAKKAMQQQAPAKRLPQTGEEDNSSMSEVGILGLLAGSLGLFGLGKKRKRDGED